MGERIRNLRKAKKLSMVALAENVDMTTQNLWNLENDMVGKTFEKLAPLAKALGCRIDDLFPEMDVSVDSVDKGENEDGDGNEGLNGWGK